VTARRVSHIMIGVGALALAGVAFSMFLGGMGSFLVFVALGLLATVGFIVSWRAATRHSEGAPDHRGPERALSQDSMGGDLMSKAARVFWMLVWLGGLAIGGSIILSITASRVGEHKSSTYGHAYSQFRDSWGGEIGIVPPEFALERVYTVEVYNKESEKYETEYRTEQIPLIPDSITIDSVVDYGEQERGLLRFNAFEAHTTETHTIPNQTEYSGKLLVTLANPQNANLMYDFSVSVPEKGTELLRPVMEESLVVASELRPGEKLVVVITYATKGMDIFKYNLSAYRNKVIDSLEARIALNTQDFEIYRFGLPHETEMTATGANIRFKIEDFSTTQDLGISFDSKQAYLDQIESLMRYSPVSLLLYLGAIFIFAQILSVRFNVLHYLFIAAIDVFYYLFVSYLIRFFGVGLTFAMSIALTAAMFLVYCPNVFGWRFSRRVAGPYLFASTVLLSLVFLMPIFRGILFVTLVFLVFMSIMVAVSRSNISQWPILTGEAAAEEGA